MRVLIMVYITTFALFACSPKTQLQSQMAQPHPMVKERLNHPFGTILKMDVEIFDGDSTYEKGNSGNYFMKILRIEDSIITDTIILPFKDETGSFPADDFSLYKKLYHKETGTLTSIEINKMKLQYVEKRFRIAAYESGEFTGLPNGYNNYQEERADKSFHFKNYLVVIGIPKK
ncbi:hypothetical protein [Lacibacter sediminis]|uniref:Lipoprotein n=1 Tax=Lacibacter sediminis TaxID=2760713 RepID=A0A7G5XLS9_9BACT|nr:hypothetical protein [Lacibacter sediminis]QNA46432.1 hypothetical protein H4075_09745 [Lacibacter sediminis]